MDAYRDFLNCFFAQINAREDETTICEAISCGLSVEEYIKCGFEKVLNDWEKESPGIIKPNFMVSLKVGDKDFDVPVNTPKGNLNSKSIFDIASMTKLYTEVLLFRIIKGNPSYKDLLNKRLSDFPDFAKRYDYNPSNEKFAKNHGGIKCITIRDILQFNSTMETEYDMRPFSPKYNKEVKPIDALHSIGKVNGSDGYYKYTDMGMMILSEFLEYLTNKSYEELIKEYIIDPLGLKETFITLPEELKERYVATDINRESGGVNDPKRNTIKSGHAGILTTSRDYIKFLDSIFKAGFIFENDYDPLLFEFLSPSNTLYETYYVNGQKEYYSVKEGDTWDSIANATGISKDDLIKENGDISLKKGINVHLPLYFILKSSDSIKEIEKLYGITKDELEAVNGPLDNVIFGQKIKIPITNDKVKRALHLRVFGIGNIGNLNITTPKFRFGEKETGTLASDTISAKGLSVQGSTRGHGEISTYNLWAENSDDNKPIFNQKVDTVFVILTDVYTQKSEVTYEVDGVRYSTYDPRRDLPYIVYKKFINIVANARAIELYNQYANQYELQKPIEKR